MDLTRVAAGTRAVLTIATVLSIAACTTPVRPPTGPATATRAPVEQTRDTVTGVEYRVVSEASDLRILAFADGPMARLGHPHVIGGPSIHGRIILASAFADSHLALTIEPAALMLDLPSWRAAEGFDPDLPEDAIAATRSNLLGPGVLDVERFPQITIESTRITGPIWQPDITVHITLKGVTRALDVPVSLAVSGDCLEAAGRFILRQSEFGMTPFSTAGGALRVADDLIVRFRIRAVREAALTQCHQRPEQDAR